MYNAHKIFKVFYGTNYKLSNNNFYLYLIFTNFGAFLMIIGGIILFFAIAIYFIRKAFLKNASKFQYQYQNFEFKNFNQDFNNRGFQGNFYNQTSKLQEAKEFLVFHQLHQKRI